MKKTQSQIVMSLLMKKNKPMTIAEVAKGAKILVPNARRILGTGVKSGIFNRVSTGTYEVKRVKIKKINYSTNN